MDTNITATAAQIEDAYETGASHGYGIEAIPEDLAFATLAELQAWERGYNAGQQERVADDAHRAQLDALGF